MKTDDFVRAVDALVPRRELKDRVVALGRRPRRARLERPGRLLAALGAAAAVCACAVVLVALAGNGGAPGTPGGVAATGARTGGTAATQGGATAATQPAAAKLPKDVVNFLILGTDLDARRAGDGAPGHTDCMMLARIDTAAKSVSLVFIPRDTYVTIYDAAGKPAQKDRIGAAFTAGGGLKGNGAACAVNTVKQYLGGAVPIDYYALFDMDFVRELIDSAGGVTVDVDISLDAPSAGVSLRPGKQRLDGAQALAYVRDRHHTKDGDIGRGGHMQQVMIALLKDLQKGNIVARLPELYQAFSGSVTTSPGFGAAQIAALAAVAGNVDASAVKQYALDGKGVRIGGMSVIAADLEKKKQVIREVFGVDYTAQDDDTIR